MTAADAAAVWADTPFLTAARDHACTVVEPSAVRAGVLAELFRAATGERWPGGNG